MALREVGGLRTGDVCSSQLRRSAPPTGRRGKVRKEHHLAYTVAILKTFQWLLLCLFLAFPQCYRMWSTCAAFSLWNVQSEVATSFHTPTITFPRGATWSGDLPCCAAASWSRAKYGLPALSTVFPSAGARRRQRGQTCFPQTPQRQRKQVNIAVKTEQIIHITLSHNEEDGGLNIRAFIFDAQSWEHW